MQQTRTRRSNRERSDATRTALLAAARKLFVTKGFGGTGTPEIVAAANVTRGALYHHFADKTDLFRAVIEQEAYAVADRITRESREPATDGDGLELGSDGYFEAMAEPGRARLLLIEGPSVLGPEEMDRIDQRTGGATLKEGLAAALPEATLRRVSLDALTEVLSAAFDRAALAIAQGRSVDDYKGAIRLIFEHLPRETKRRSGQSPSAT